LTAIRTESLSKHYGKIKALDNLNMEVPDNIVFGFLGPNGAGKTTTVKLLTGFSRPTSGKAWVDEERVGEGNLELQSKTGLLPDVPSFYNWMTGREFLQLAGELHELPHRVIRQRSAELLDMVELSKADNRRIGGYSRGMRQRLGIAQALINQPRVLFMDEPTSALDPIGRREVLELILRLRESTTIFMSTHILSDVERVCDMVGVVNNGRLVTISSIGELRRKYTRSAFEMEFLEDATAFTTSLKDIDWLTDPQLTIEGGTQVLRVGAVDIEQARRELPRLISESGLTLARYELVLPDLEEIFMEILGDGEAK
jgi:ABC-2 type transport system ATP-binding protein